MKDFLAMGGYAWYVWGSYGVTFFLFMLELALLVRRARRNEAKA
jgi:heme exporter protein D